MIESARTFRLLSELRRGARAAPPAIDRRQARLLDAVLSHARESVPFYRRLWDGLPLELGRLPVMTGAQVRTALESGELLAESQKASATFPSTGSTDRPLEFPRGPSEQRRWRAGALRAWFEHGYRWRDTTVQFDAHPGPSHPLQRLGVGRTTWISPELEGSEIARHFAAARPDVAVATPTVLRRLCRALGTAGGAKPRIVFSQGEVLDAGTAALVEQSLGVAPVDLYGLTETGYVGWQCELREHLHVNAETCVVEVLVEGRPAAPGERGSVVVTDLLGRVAPVIRYDTGDLAVAAGGPCACGRTLPLLGRIEGRAADVLTAPDGSVVTTRRVLDALAPLTPDDYRVRRGASGVPELLAGPDVADPSAAAARLSGLLGGLDVTARPGFTPSAGYRVKTPVLA